MKQFLLFFHRIVLLYLENIIRILRRLVNFFAVLQCTFLRSRGKILPESCWYIHMYYWEGTL